MSIDDIMWIAGDYRTADTPSDARESKAKLRAAIAQHVAEAVAAEREALTDLVNQIRKCDPVDDLGHRMTMNVAYLRAEKAARPLVLHATEVRNGED